MQSALKASRFSQLFRLRSVKLGVPSQLVETKPPLFHRPLPWWARWTWGLIACDIFLTGSAIELTWNHWSSLTSDLEAPTTILNGQDASTSDKFALRPSWQRGGLCTAHLVFGVGIATALLVTQARFVRTLAILPPSTIVKHDSSASRHIFLQCAHNFRKRGIVFPLNKCSLQEGRNETEMILRVAGERGHWYIGLEDAVVNGHSMSLGQARNAILANWGGKQLGNWKSKFVVDSRWKSGPIRRV